MKSHSPPDGAFKAERVERARAELQRVVTLGRGELTAYEDVSIETTVAMLEAAERMLLELAEPDGICPPAGPLPESLTHHGNPPGADEDDEP